MSKVVLNFVILTAAIQISCQDMLDKIFRSDVWHCKLKPVIVNAFNNSPFQWRPAGFLSLTRARWATDQSGSATRSSSTVRWSEHYNIPPHAYSQPLSPLHGFAPPLFEVWSLGIQFLRWKLRLWFWFWLWGYFISGHRTVSLSTLASQH